MIWIREEGNNRRLEKLYSEEISGFDLLANVVTVIKLRKI
jgi:hypothetical protein